MSLWLDEPYAPRPPLDGDASADVAVVGGGIAGAALAYALSRDGLSVIVVEGRTVAEAASGRNAGFILTGLAENYAAACRRYGQDRAARVWRSTATNRALVRAAVRRHAIDCELRWNGSLQVAGSDAEWAEIEESARELAAHGVLVSCDDATRSALYAEDGEVHPARLTRGVADAAAGQGARLYERTRATRVRRDAVVTDRGTVRAGAVAVCVNAYSEHLLPRSRIVPVRGQVLATRPLRRRLFERPAYAHRGFRYWRQTAEGRVVVGGWRDLALADETGEEERTNPLVQAALDEFLRDHGVDLDLVTHRWAGIMGFSHDGLPYLGRRADGVYVAGGFTGHGLAFALFAGELVAALIRLGRHPDADLFDPERP